MLIAIQVIMATCFRSIFGNGILGLKVVLWIITDLVSFVSSDCDGSWVWIGFEANDGEVKVVKFFVFVAVCINIS